MMWAVICVVLYGLVGCTQQPRTAATVLWISIDGLRGDYIQATSSTLSRLCAKVPTPPVVFPVFPR